MTDFPGFEGQRVRWLLTELTEKTAGRLSVDSQQSLLDEVASHLDEAIRARIELGSAPERAEQEAVRAFGQPDAYIAEILSVHEQSNRRKLGRLRRGKADLPTMITFCAACLWFPTCGLMELRDGGTLWLALVSTALIFGFAIFSFRARRLQTASIGVASLSTYFAGILALSGLWLNLASRGFDNVPLIPTWKASDASDFQLRGIAAFNGAIAEYQKGRSLHFEQMSPEQFAKLPLEDRSILFRVVGWPQNRQSLPTSHAWRQNWLGGPYFQSLLDIRKNSILEVGAIKEAQESLPFGDFVYNFWKYFGWACLWFGCGSIVNGLSVGLARLSDDFSRQRKDQSNSRLPIKSS